MRSSRFETYGAGRTDAGVHALGQVAHLDTAATLPPATLVARVNDALPADINVLAAERVAPRFHARHSARREELPVPDCAAAHGVREAVRLVGPRRARRRPDRRCRHAALVGFGDFRAFTDDDPDEKSTRVAIEHVTVARRDSLILIRIVGSHFLWKMVRRIVGVLVEVGRHQLQSGAVVSFLAGDSDLPAKLTAPASGLFLERVFYENPPAEWPLEPAIPVSAVPPPRA